jgi:Ca2+-binding EF-hand superfamily protein
MALEDVGQAFRTWDKDGNGMISKKEFTDIILRLSPEMSQEDLDVLFDAADINDDGMLNYEEFFGWLWAPDEELMNPNNNGGIEAKAEQGMISNQHGLWEDAVSDSRTKFIDSYPQERVNQYFDEVQARLGGQEYEEHVKGSFFNRVDKNKDGKVDFQEAYSLIRKSLQCAADITGSAKPTAEEIRAAFDTHDELSSGRGRLGVDEFTNLCRYLQVRVAEAMLPLSSLVSTDATA